MTNVKRMIALAILTLLSACATGGATNQATVQNSFCAKWPDRPPVEYFESDLPEGVNSREECNPRTCPEIAQKDLLVAYWETRCTDIEG